MQMCKIKLKSLIGAIAMTLTVFSEGHSSIRIYRGIFFDLDETLLNFRIAENKGLSHIHEKYYKRSVDKPDFSKAFHQVNKGLWDAFERNEVPLGVIGRSRFEVLSRKFSCELDIPKVSEEYELYLGRNAEWLPGVEEAIAELKKAHLLSVITNGFTRVQRIKYEIFGIEKWCHSYLISEEVGVFKPDRKIFDIALEEAALRTDEVLMVGDSLGSDYKGALNAGIDFCWVNPSGMELPDGMLRPRYIVKSVVDLVDILGDKTKN